MRVTRAVTVLLAVAVATFITAPPSAAAGPKKFQTLRPGEHVNVDSPVRVNVVLVGYQPGSVDMKRLRSMLPAESNPTVRDPLYFGIDQPVGLHHRYDYRTQFAGAAFNDAFFSLLASSGFVAPRTWLGDLYNDQEHNTLDVGPTLRVIDANATERWLEDRASRDLGIGATEETVYLVNWWGRPDFQFHVFLSPGERDPDTGVDHGRLIDRSLSAWGGASGRSWFFDLSAGPEWWQGSWNVDDADITGDGITDYRIPPAWEYGNVTGYRPFNDLTGDLGKVIRYVAVDMLFTPSPFYDPGALVPGPTGDRVIAINQFDGDPAMTAASGITPDAIRANHQALTPYYDTKVTVTARPLSGEVRRVWGIISLQNVVDDCWRAFGYLFAEEWCWFDAHRSDLFPSKPGDAVMPGIGWTAPADEIAPIPWVGIADDNQTDGSPGFVSMFDSSVRRARYGIAYTRTATHEFGHMAGLSHPHDGWDPGERRGVNPDMTGDFFGWLGDSVATVMSYQEITYSFSVFDKDNMNRWTTARLLDRANAEIPDILAASSSPAVRNLLDRADETFGRSLAAFADNRWADAASKAVDADHDVQRAAEKAKKKQDGRGQGHERTRDHAHERIERPHVEPSPIVAGRDYAAG
jgi:hypothetical protein